MKVVLENMDSRQFEIMVADLYRKQGYDVVITAGSHDGGIDVLGERKTTAGTERLAIQCKHQVATVGRPVLQALWGVVNDDQRFTQGVLVTSADFSAEARQFADGKRLTLIDGQTVRKLVAQHGVAIVSDAPQQEV